MLSAGSCRSCPLRQGRRSVRSLKVEIDLVRYSTIELLQVWNWARFRVFEDGVEQKIGYFSHNEVLAWIGIVLDGRHSLAGTMVFAKKQGSPSRRHSIGTMSFSRDVFRQS